MSLDVYIQPLSKLPHTGDEFEYVCSLDDDAYYWFLYPFFDDLAKQSGSMIDLYEYTAFTGEALDALEHTLTNVQEVVAVKPAVWKDAESVRLWPVPDDPRRSIDKEQISLLLRKLQTAVIKAKATNAYVTFFGD